MRFPVDALHILMVSDPEARYSPFGEKAIVFIDSPIKKGEILPL